MGHLLRPPSNFTGEISLAVEDVKTSKRPSELAVDCCSKWNRLAAMLGRGRQSMSSKPLGVGPSPNAFLCRCIPSAQRSALKPLTGRAYGGVFGTTRPRSIRAAMGGPLSESVLLDVVPRVRKHRAHQRLLESWLSHCKRVLQQILGHSGLDLLPLSSRILTRSRPRPRRLVQIHYRWN